METNPKPERQLPYLTRVEGKYYGHYRDAQGNVRRVLLCVNLAKAEAMLADLAAGKPLPEPEPAPPQRPEPRLPCLILMGRMWHGRFRDAGGMVRRLALSTNKAAAESMLAALAASADPQLAALLKAWPRLPAQTKDKISALLKEQI